MTSVAPGRAQPQRSVPLSCRIAPGPWLDCLMMVERVGERWNLIVGKELIGFRHDGFGQVEMQRAQTSWKRVEATWSQDKSLCWNGICARGDMPLD